MGGNAVKTVFLGTLAGLAVIVVGSIPVVRYAFSHDKGEWELQLATLAALPLAVLIVVVVPYFVRSRSRPGTRAGFTAVFAPITLYCVLWAMVVLSVMYLRQHEEGRRNYRNCMNNMQMLTDAMRMYVAEWDDRFPRAETWCDDLVPYLPQEAEPYLPFICPTTPEPKSGYAFNASLSEQRRAALSKAKDTIVLFESDQGWNAHGGPGMLPRVPRHFWAGGGRGENYATAQLDWRGVRTLPRKQNPDGTWAKEPEAEVRWEVGVPKAALDHG
jgi:hypothetical protein